MHELAIAESLVRQVGSVAKEEGLVRVRKVALKVGVLRQVVPGTLRDAFSLLADKTATRGAKLKIETVAVRVRCRACGKEAEGFLAACPSCRSHGIELIAGRELFIDFIEGDRRKRMGVSMANSRSRRSGSRPNASGRGRPSHGLIRDRAKVGHVGAASRRDPRRAGSGRGRPSHGLIRDRAKAGHVGAASRRDPRRAGSGRGRPSHG